MIIFLDNLTHRRGGTEFFFVLWCLGVRLLVCKPRLPEYEAIAYKGR
ncbi:hypothetical protein WKK05_23330 [Nostoc sp. UHCC 0302]